MRLTEQFLKNALPDLALEYTTFPESFSWSIDTRTLQPGDMYVALPGNRVDGHDFLEEALAKGARGLLIAESHKGLLSRLDPKKRTAACIMIAAKPVQALIQLATAWRAQFSYPVIGVTGSAGKTSTKELVGHILKAANIAHLTSQGNQNTLIGASLNILRMTEDHKYAIFEMGVNRRGEMAQLAALVRPTTALITNVGHAHMEGLGTIGDIAAEKRAIFSFFHHDSVGIINGDQPLLANVSYPHPLIKFGLKTTNQVQARKIRISNQNTSFILKLYGTKYPLILPTTHGGFLNNILAAVSMAYYIGIPVETILAAISQPLTIKDRFEKRPLKKGDGFVISDCYNANPENMKASLLAFQHLQHSGKKIAVLGDMRELGTEAPFWHSQIGRFLQKTSSIRHIVLVGEMVAWTKKTLPLTAVIHHVPTWQEAEQAVQSMIDKPAAVLIKGSRSMNLDKLVESLC